MRAPAGSQTARRRVPSGSFEHAYDGTPTCLTNVLSSCARIIAGVEFCGPRRASSRAEKVLRTLEHTRQFKRTLRDIACYFRRSDMLSTILLVSATMTSLK